MDIDFVTTMSVIVAQSSYALGLCLFILTRRARKWPLQQKRQRENQTPHL
jgi:hypothetical protein